jgi:solute carrier family 25 carnitine/acylcarnitine transporter 20/29
MPDKYHSAYGCFKSILANEGVSGFFKGVWAPTYAQFVMGALAFAGNEFTKKFLEPDLKPGESCGAFNGYISGCAGGLAQSIVLVPTDLVKCKMQVNNVDVHASKSTVASGNAYKGSLDCIVQTLRSEGVRGLYRGFIVTCCREVPSYGVYFLSYDKLNDYMTEKLKFQSTISVVIAGGVAGSLSWLSVYPVDVIKTNLQIQPSGVQFPGGKAPTTMLSMASYLLQQHGPKIFTRGLGKMLINQW